VGIQFGKCTFLFKSLKETTNSIRHLPTPRIRATTIINSDNTSESMCEGVPNIACCWNRWRRVQEMVEALVAHLRLSGRSWLLGVFLRKFIWQRRIWNVVFVKNSKEIITLHGILLSIPLFFLNFTEFLAEFRMSRDMISQLLSIFKCNAVFKSDSIRHKTR